MVSFTSALCYSTYVAHYLCLIDSLIPDSPLVPGCLEPNGLRKDLQIQYIFALCFTSRLDYSALKLSNLITLAVNRINITLYIAVLNNFCKCGFSF